MGLACPDSKQNTVSSCDSRDSSSLDITLNIDPNEDDHELESKHFDGRKVISADKILESGIVEKMGTPGPQGLVSAIKVEPESHKTTLSNMVMFCFTSSL